MKTARFKTKLSKVQKRKNALFILFVLLCSYIGTLLFMYAIGAFEDSNLLENCLLALALTFFVLIMLLFPVLLLALALGLQRGKAKRVRDNATFVSVQEIDYYREVLRGISPATLSLLVDLELYGNKDIVATLLQMHNRKEINLQQNGTIEITQQNCNLVEPSERELLQMIQSGTLNNKKAVSAWKQNRFLEAEEKGCLQKKTVTPQKGLQYLYAALISTVVCMVLWAIFLANEVYENVFLAFIFLLIIGALMFVPWYLTAREVSYHKRNDILWQRTNLGNELAEKLAGLSRFMHEFSTLSQAQKEQVSLWDDYLVYAVVLEENEKIVKDICKLYSIK